jgi:pimeloyl-ACP methyl ester carboxylesterase
MTVVDIAQQAVDVWGGRLRLRFQVIGSGAPLIYLHPAGGLFFDPFLASLGTEYRIYAPEIPGTGAGDSHAIDHVDDLHDLVLIYEEAIRHLNLPTAPIAYGQSFGGMLAAELAAHFPRLFEKVVLLDPIGLWRDDLPIANWMTIPPADLPALLFKDPDCPSATAMFALPDDPEQAIAMQSALVWALGCTGKFVWPIPDRGLRKRLHRISVPTLIVWGEDDGLVPVGYAKEFGDAIRGSRVEIVPNCGHIPQMEQSEITLGLTRQFLRSC